MTRRSWRSRTTRAALAVGLSGVVALSSAALVATAGATRNATKARVVARIQKTSKYGKILVTTRGMTLYTYASDTRAHSNCNGACLAIWPPLTVPKGIKPVAKGVRGLQVIVRANGVRQVTYKGWPLYTYVNDKTRGVISGNAVSNFYVAKLTVKAARSTSGGSGW